MIPFAGSYRTDRGETIPVSESLDPEHPHLLNLTIPATGGDITGSPGVCLSTRGPGATNMVNGVAHAFLDRSPLIAITDTYSRPVFETLYF